MRPDEKELANRAAEDIKIDDRKRRPERSICNSESAAMEGGHGKDESLGPME